LREFIVAGRRAYCLRHESRLKTDYRLFAIEEWEQGALIDTQLQMRAFENALETGLIPWLEGYRVVRRNARLGDSLIDYLLEGEGNEAYLEVKSAVLRDGDHAMYPDCPSLRGQRHVRELTEHEKGGGKSIILFVAALPGVRAFKPNKDADPVLCDLLIKALRAGVVVKALNIIYEPRESSVCMVTSDLPVHILTELSYNNGTSSRSEGN
jgi:sugar fermentation stimulation protein A